MESLKLLKPLRNTKRQWQVYKIRVSKEYKRNYKKLSEEDKNSVDRVVYKFLEGEKLETKHKDHKLKGNYQGLRECHIKPDLLLIYQKEETHLILPCINVGSHSDLL